MIKIPGSQGDCVICGQDQAHRPQCYVGLSVCSGKCESELEAQVAAELRGEVVAEGTWHPFRGAAGRPCEVCGRGLSLHVNDSWKPKEES